MHRITTALLLAFALFLSTAASAATWCVNTDGSAGCFTSIQTAINSASNGDTIKIMPGVYDEAITVAKQLAILGSGFETCAIAYSGPTSDPAVHFTTGADGSKIAALRISNALGRGVYVYMQGSITVASCFVAYNFSDGILINAGFANIRNCVVAQNADDGIAINGSLVRVGGTISYANGGYGMRNLYGTAISVSNNNCYYTNALGSTYALQVGPNDLLNVNPQFVSYATDLHLQTGSPCINTGIPGVDAQDCDGSDNDMGIYGGLDAICGPGPVVESLIIIPPTVVKGETFKIQAKGVTR